MQSTKSPTVTWDMTRIVEIAEKLRALREEMISIFPERSHLITQAIFALLTREHLLIYGTFGAGKTDLVHTLYESIVGSEVFSIEMTKSTPESQIIGVPDVRKMREEGRIWYPRDGGIFEADLAEFDELLDATPALLRALLGIMNERMFKRGRQIEYIRLMTAIASTNGDPTAEVKRSPELGAVIDRFLFKAKVEYLQEAENRRRMYRKYLAGMKPSVKITIDDLRYISDMVVSSCQITDPRMIDVYDQVIQAVRETRLQNGGAVISDRTACKALELVEANAALNGRFEVQYEDFGAIRWALCMGGDNDAHEQFKAVVQPIIDAANQAEQQSVDELQVRLLTKIGAETPDFPEDTPDSALVGLRRQLTFKLEEVEGIKPQLDSTRDFQGKLTEQIKTLITAVDNRIAGHS